MSKFKIGQKVKIIGNHYGNGEKSRYQSIVGKIGTIKSIDEDGYPYEVVVDGELLNDFLESDLQAITKDWEDLEGGDIIVSDGTEAMILAHSGLLFARSKRGDFKRYWSFCTKEQLIEDGWSIKQDPIEEEVEELTMEQVCKELGREVKIKK
jgi:hypothetical protein